MLRKPGRPKDTLQSYKSKADKLNAQDDRALQMLRESDPEFKKKKKKITDRMAQRLCRGNKKLREKEACAT